MPRSAQDPRTQKQKLKNAGYTLGFLIHGSWAGRKSSMLGVWAAPAAPTTIPEGGGAKPPHRLEWVFGAAGAAQTPTNRRFPAGPKTMCFILRKLTREIESRAPKNSKLKSGPESKSIRSFDSGSGGPGGHGRPPEPIRRASGALPGKTWDPPRTWAKTPMSQT
jgi:hypothetical protein